MNRALFSLLLALSACDWQQSALLNSVPIDGTRTDDMYVYLAYDGLDPVTVREAMARGAFAGAQWKTASFVNSFPGSSDVSWTRIMRAGKLKGYEYEYYDPAQDKLVDSGYSGLAKHILPNLISVVSVIAGFEIAGAILIESGLSYLGLGVQPPTVDWGRMIADGQTYLTTHWELSTLPGIAVVITALGLSLLADGLADLLRPE